MNHWQVQWISYDSPGACVLLNYDYNDMYTALKVCMCVLAIGISSSAPSHLQTHVAMHTFNAVKLTASNPDLSHYSYTTTAIMPECGYFDTSRHASAHHLQCWSKYGISTKLYSFQIIQCCLYFSPVEIICTDYKLI